MLFLPLPPQIWIEFWSIEVEAITVMSEERDSLCSFFPAPGLSVEAFDYSQFRLHWNNVRTEPTTFQINGIRPFYKPPKRKAETRESAVRMGGDTRAELRSVQSADSRRSERAARPHPGISR